MRVRLRIVKEEDRRDWEEPYLYVTGPGVPFHWAKLEFTNSKKQNPEDYEWESVEVIRE
jgi:hypothetical protein